MSCRVQRDVHLADAPRLAIAQRFKGTARTFAKPGAHDRERFRGRENRCVSGAGVVAVAVGDDGAVHGPHGIDEEPAGFAPQPLRGGVEP